MKWQKGTTGMRKCMEPVAKQVWQQKVYEKGPGKAGTKVTCRETRRLREVVRENVDL